MSNINKPLAERLLYSRKTHTSRTQGRRSLGNGNLRVDKGSCRDMCAQRPSPVRAIGRHRLQGAQRHASSPASRRGAENTGRAPSAALPGGAEKSSEGSARRAGRETSARQRPPEREHGRAAAPNRCRTESGLCDRQDTPPSGLRAEGKAGPAPHTRPSSPTAETPQRR